MGERRGVVGEIVVGEIATVALVLVAHALNEAFRVVEALVRMLRGAGHGPRPADPAG